MISALYLKEQISIDNKLTLLLIQQIFIEYLLCVIQYSVVNERDEKLAYNLWKKKLLLSTVGEEGEEQ